MTPSDPPVLAPTTFRSVTGLTVMAGMGALLLSAAYQQDGIARALLVAAGLAAVAAALSLWRGRHDCLRWTAAGLVDGTDQIIAPRADVVSVERSAMAMRPSNGFSLRLSRRLGFAWKPGLYWRIGRRVGVGGLTSPGLAKALADHIALDTAPPV